MTTFTFSRLQIVNVLGKGPTFSKIVGNFFFKTRVHGPVCFLAFHRVFFPKCHPWTQGKRSFRLTFEKCSKSALKKTFTTRFKNVFVGVLRQNRKTKACFAMFCLLDRWSYFNFSFSKCWINPQEKMCFLFDLKRKRSHTVFFCAKKTLKPSWLNKRCRVQFVFFLVSISPCFFVLLEKEGTCWVGGRSSMGKESFFRWDRAFFFTDHCILEVSYHLCTLQWCI